MSARLKSILFSVITLLIGFYLALWLVEGMARLAFHGTLFTPTSDGELQQQHPTRGAAFTPSSTIGMFKLANAATATINSMGFRGVEVSQAPTAGRTRILLLSDSNGYGSGVDDSETLAVQLQQALGDDKYEVLNFSVPAYSNVQQYIWLTEQGLALKPHVVLLGFTPVNDIQTNYQPLQALYQSTSKRPYATLNSAGGLSIDNSFMNAHSAKNPGKRPLHILRDFFVGPMVKRLVEQGLERMGGGRKTDPNIWIGWPYLKSFSEQHGTLKTADYEKLWSEAWGVTQDIIKSMRSETEKSGAKFIMFQHPGKIEGDANHLAALQQGYPGLEFDVGKFERELRSFAASNAISMISATEQVKAGENLYFGIDDDHMNAKGYAILAKALAEDLRKQNMLPLQQSN